MQEVIFDAFNCNSWRFSPSLGHSCLFVFCLVEELHPFFFHCQCFPTAEKTISRCNRGNAKCWKILCQWLSCWINTYIAWQMNSLSCSKTFRVTLRTPQHPAAKQNPGNSSGFRDILAAKILPFVQSLKERHYFQFDILLRCSGSGTPC